MRNATRNIQFLIVLYEETLLVGKLHVFGGKKDVSKTTEKTDKGRTAKEEAHELLLKEEVAIRKKVKAIQRNLSMVWRAREMAVSNPIRTQSACIHVCNWALDIATALRLICLEESHTVLDLISVADEIESSERPSLSVFDRAINGLSSSSKFGPLPVDTFIFAFPWILLSPKKTTLHDKVLRVLYLHTNPVLLLPRLRMLSVLYHVLGVVHAYQAAIGSTLNE